jgi:hypothetical protein
MGIEGPHAVFSGRKVRDRGTALSRTAWDIRKFSDHYRTTECRCAATPLHLLHPFPFRPFFRLSSVDTG